MSGAAFFITSFLFLSILSCSSEKLADVNKQKPSEVVSSRVSEISQTQFSSTNVSYSLEIIPQEASRNSMLYLIPKGFNLSDAKVEWLVNGNPVINTVPHQFKTIDTKKGDKVQAKVTVQGKEILSNIVQIKNAPPEISQAKILPEVSKSGNILRVDVIGSDIDGDNVTFTYEWTKNGEPVGNNERLDVPLKRGDKISVKITPFDGEAYGRPVVLEREISKVPPKIIEDKKFNYTFDGKVYTYQVKAIDPDGDTLTYSLKSAPQDMIINPKTGLIQWNVPADFKGKAPFIVSVSDGHGGETSQSLTVEIRSEARK